MELVRVESYETWLPYDNYKDQWTWIEYEDGHKTRYHTTLN